MVWYKPWTWYPRLVSSTTTREAEFDDEQYSMLTGLMDYEADVHPDCGHLLSESTSIDADIGNVHGKWFYKAQLPIRCHACTALNQMQDAYSDEADSARLWVVDRIDREPR